MGWSGRTVLWKVGYVEETIHFQRKENDPTSKHVVEFTHLFYVFDALLIRLFSVNGIDVLQMRERLCGIK